MQTEFLETTFVTNWWSSQRRSPLSPVIPIFGDGKNIMALELPSNSPLRWSLQHTYGKAYSLSATCSTWIDFSIQACHFSNSTILYNVHLNMPLLYVFVTVGKPHVYLVKFSRDQHSTSCSHFFTTSPHKQIIFSLSKMKCSVKATYRTWQIWSLSRNRASVFTWWKKHVNSLFHALKQNKDNIVIVK